jgi:apolipoprotein N-acyltransferase
MRALWAALVSGILLYLSQGLADVWALAWVAPTPLLWLAYGDAPRWHVLVASLAAFALGQTYLVQCYWGQLPPSIIAPLVVAMCVTFAITVVFSGEALRRGSPWAALLAFPALWTAIEYAIALVSPHGSFGALGYAEVSFPAGAEVAALFGVHAVTFVLCLSANAVALLLRRQWTAGSAGVAVCALALIFGVARLAEPEGPRVSVAALADADARNAEHRERTLASEEAATRTYAAKIEGLKGVRVVAIPEGAVKMREGDRDAVLAPLAAASRASDVMVVVGTFTPAPAQNRAFAFLPDGAVETYEKRHLLPPFETEIAGHDPGLLGGGYATQICKDMDFAGTVRGTAGHGVRLMIVPANDFGRDGWIHARMAIMRGVENGFAVLRSAFDGLETISDAQGRLLARAPTSRHGMVEVMADVPLGPGPTLYTQVGDVFPWLCALVSLLIGARLVSGSRPAATVDDAAGPPSGRAAPSLELEDNSTVSGLSSGTISNERRPPNA